MPFAIRFDNSVPRAVFGFGFMVAVVIFEFNTLGKVLQGVGTSQDLLWGSVIPAGICVAMFQLKKPANLLVRLAIAALGLIPLVAGAIWGIIEQLAR